MKQTTELATEAINIGHRAQEPRVVAATGGLRVRTDLRAGLAWDDLDDQAQQLWSNLTNALSGLIGGSDTSS